MRDARVVIGVPLHNGERHVTAALRSLLGQSYGSYALVVVDDASTDRTPELAAELVAGDPRVSFFRNPTRLAMVENWRRTYQLAREHHPGAEFFAWGSDHDLWDPAWLSTLVGVLGEHAAAVGAWTGYVKIDETGRELPAPTPAYSSAGVQPAAARVAHAIRGMVAGNMIYGLFRTSALDRTDGFPATILPDRLLLTQLSLLGEIHHVAQPLWQRRVVGDKRVTATGQRRTLFVDPSERPARPWPVEHATAFRSWIAQPGLLGAEERDDVWRAFRRALAAEYAAAQGRKVTKRIGRLHSRLAALAQP